MHITATQIGTDAIVSTRGMSHEAIGALLDLSIETLIADGRLPEAIDLARRAGLDLAPLYMEPMRIADDDARLAVEWCEQHR